MDSNNIELETLKEQLKELKEENRELSKRISKIEQSREKTEFQYQEIMKSLDKLNDITIPNLMKELETLKNKPVKRYETGINAIISGVVAIVISLVFKGES